MNELWSNTPCGIPGNDDLGAMSAWYVWSAIGLYPGIPGRADLFVGSPLFQRIRIERATAGAIVIDAPAARTDVPFVAALRLDGQPVVRAVLPPDLVEHGGNLTFVLSARPTRWARRP